MSSVDIKERPAAQRRVPQPALPPLRQEQAPQQTGRRREHRVDLLRGFALITIFINHVPGNFLSNFTHTNFGFSDAAEIFVTLAGFAAAQAYFVLYERGEKITATLKALHRAGLLYLAHIASTVGAIALLSAAHIFFSRPGYLKDTEEPLYLGITWIFNDPPRGYIGIATLGTQLGYFNVLPMYMVLLALLPVFMWIAQRFGLKILLAASVLLWFLAGTFSIDMPKFPETGGWFFNPFSWQLLFVGGFVLGVLWKRGWSITLPPWLVWFSTIFALLALVVVQTKSWDLLHPIPLVNVLWSFEKGWVPIPRLVHVCALGVLLFATPLWRWLDRVPTNSPLHVIGRNALPVFCWGSLGCMAAAVARNEFDTGPAGDFAVMAVMLAAVVALAYLYDWIKAKSRAKPA